MRNLLVLLMAALVTSCAGVQPRTNSDQIKQEQRPSNLEIQMMETLRDRDLHNGI